MHFTCLGPEIGGRRSDDLRDDVEAEGVPDHQDPQPLHARRRVRGKAYYNDCFKFDSHSDKLTCIATPLAGASDARLRQEDTGKVAGARAAGNAGTGEQL